MDIVVEQIPEPQSDAVRYLITVVQEPTQADEEAPPEIAPTPQPKKRGRPQGNKNKQK